MSQFIETIRVNRGRPENLKMHEQRMRKTVAHHFDTTLQFSLEDHLSEIKFSESQLIKCTITYNTELVKTKITPYTKKKVIKLKCVYDNHIEYNFKDADRNHINTLYSRKEACQDILIIKNGKITDTSYCNVALLKEDKWYTPKSSLLDGTQREKLLQSNTISKLEIHISEIKQFQKIALFNAMIPWEERIEINIDNIIS